MLVELDRHVLVRRVDERDLEREVEHVLGIERHPGGAVGLLDVAAGRQRRAAIEDADVVEAQKAALEEVASVAVLAVEPPGVVGQQAVEDSLQERDRLVAHASAVEAIVEERRPGMHGWVDVVEVPLVGRELAVRVLVPFEQHERQLIGGEFGIDERQ